MWWLALVVGCAVHTTRSGLVQVDRARPSLLEQGGRRSRLVLTEDARPVALLDGCQVRVEGPRIGRRQVVRVWHVTDGGDGSEPYIGRLERYGSHWIVRDRGTGTEIAIQPESVGALADHEGELVMVVGFVVGPHLVQAVSWRSLEVARRE